MTAFVIERKILKIFPFNRSGSLPPVLKNIGKILVLLVKDLMKFFLGTFLYFVVTYDGNIRDTCMIQTAKYCSCRSQVSVPSGAAPSNIPNNKHQFYCLLFFIVDYPVDGSCEFGPVAFAREYLRLQQREKNPLTKMQALGVLMNKLLRILWALMRNRTFYNPGSEHAA